MHTTLKKGLTLKEAIAFIEIKSKAKKSNLKLIKKGVATKAENEEVVIFIDIEPVKYTVKKENKMVLAVRTNQLLQTALHPPKAKKKK